MITLKRLSPPPQTPVVTPQRVVDLWEWLDTLAARRRRQNPDVCPHGLDLTDLPAITAEATAWLEKHRGVICRPGDYRLEIPHLNADRLKAQKGHHVVAFRLPFARAWNVNAAWIDGRPSDGWYTRGGFLIHKEFSKVKEGTNLAVEFLAGWPVLPHLVSLSLSQICKHWIKCPDDRKSQTLGTSHHHILQFLLLHEPAHHKRGAVWL